MREALLRSDGVLAVGGGRGADGGDAVATQGADGEDAVATQKYDVRNRKDK